MIQSVVRRRPSVSLARRVGLLSSRGYSSIPGKELVAPISNHAVALVDLQSSAKIEGQETQVATITLQPGQTIRAEAGSMVFMTSSINMETSANFSDGMKRFMTGQALFVTDFTAVDSPGQVALAPAFPSKILRLNLQEYGGELICQKGAYVASNVGVNIELAFTKNFSAGFFGGEGFVLQKLTGEGDVLLQASGALIKKELKDGETLRVSSGTLVCFTNTIDYDVQMMPGFKNVMFGGEGLFVTTLKGPGTVWLQGMPPDRMISEIARRVPGGGIGFGIPIGMGGSGAGGEGGGSGVEGAADEAATTPVGADGGVAASDAAVEADRQATVATSGAMGDSNSPDSLFGDAVPKDVPPLTQESDNSFGDSISQENSFNDNDDFGGDQDFSDGTTFGDEEFNEFAENDNSFSSFDEGNLGDGSMSDAASEVDSEGIVDTAKSVLSSLWDFFNSDD